MFEVDLEYPRELNAATADFPIAPKSDFINEEVFSYYGFLCNVLGDNNKYDAYRKLFLTQYDTDVCNFTILKFYLQLGMKLGKVRSAIRLRQKHFAEPCIKYNTERRASVSNTFEKEFLMLLARCQFLRSPRVFF